MGTRGRAYLFWEEGRLSEGRIVERSSRLVQFELRQSCTETGAGTVLPSPVIIWVDLRMPIQEDAKKCSGRYWVVPTNEVIDVKRKGVSILAPNVVCDRLVCEHMGSFIE